MTSGEAEPEPLLSERERNESAQYVRDHVPFDRVAMRGRAPLKITEVIWCVWRTAASGRVADRQGGRRAAADHVSALFIRVRHHGALLPQDLDVYRGPARLGARAAQSFRLLPLLDVLPVRGERRGHHPARVVAREGPRAPGTHPHVQVSTLLPKVPRVQAAPCTPLQSVWAVHPADGPPLPVDCQLRGPRQLWPLYALRHRRLGQYAVPLGHDQPPGERLVGTRVVLAGAEQL